MQIQHTRVDDLAPSPWNVNVVAPGNEAKIDESIKRLGLFKPILVREVEGTLEIIGGEHRWRSAKRLGHDTVPVVNLGVISDAKAKEISLVDNGRYGEDDGFKLAELLNEIGTPDELAAFMPYTQEGLEGMFEAVNLALGDLEEEVAKNTKKDEEAAAPNKSAPTHQIMRFKVPIGDVQSVTDLIELVIKQQGFKDQDSLTNAGDALIHICNGFGK